MQKKIKFPELEEAKKAVALKSNLPHVRGGMRICPICGARFYAAENAAACHGVGGHSLRSYTPKRQAADGSELAEGESIASHKIKPAEGESAASHKIKPSDCTCQYPRVTLRNRSGHNPTCPCHRRYMTDHFRCQGFKATFNDDNSITLREIKFGSNAPLPVAVGIKYGYESITYDEVVHKINEGVVTVVDFNNLIESLAKSTKERVNRHVRPRKVTPKGFSPFGRIVPKLKGHDNPPEQGRGKRYASGKPAREKQNKETSDAWQKFEDVMTSSALTEEQVQVVDKVIRSQEWKCPHCGEVISERFGLHRDDKNWYHRPCRDKGPIELPPTDWSKVAPEWREVLRGRTDD